jgi:hypothetical protein
LKERKAFHATARASGLYYLQFELGRFREVACSGW